MKRILSLVLVILMLGSAVAVSASSAPYAKHFDNEADMLESLSAYANAFPNVEDYYPFGELEETPEDYHLEYKEVILPHLNDDRCSPDEYSYADASWGSGVNYTSNSYRAEDGGSSIRFIVYYHMYQEIITKTLNNMGNDKADAKLYNGEVDGYDYTACEYIDESGITRCDYNIAVGERLAVVYSAESFSEELLNNIDFVSTGIMLPVYVQDNLDWFTNTIKNSDILIGDANADGELNIRDATAIQLYCAELATFDEYQTDAAEFSGDGEVNIKDATEIQKKLAGLEYSSRREAYPVAYFASTPDEGVQLDYDMKSNYSVDSFHLELIRDGYVDREYTTVISSAEEFEAFFGTAVEEYDEEFFETKSLVYLYRCYGSMSCKYEPEELCFSDGILYLCCQYSEPKNGVWLDTVANYNIFIEVDKADIEGVEGVIISEHTEYYY